MKIILAFLFLSVGLFGQDESIRNFITRLDTDTLLQQEYSIVDGTGCVTLTELFQEDSLNNNYHFEMLPFDSTQHVLSYTVDGYIELIDGLDYYGTDGEHPTHELSSIDLIIEGERIVISNDAIIQFYDYNPRGRSLYARLYKSTVLSKLYYLNAWISDGAGGYNVTWVIYDGKFVMREIFIP